VNPVVAEETRPRETRHVTEVDIQEMVRRIVAATDPVKVILIGSRARETARLCSNVDLLVVERDLVAHRHEAARLHRLLRDFRVPIDITVLEQYFAERYWDVPGSVLCAAFREGRVLHA
jgi:predicted nucleotidyltransferase